MEAITEVLKSLNLAPALYGTALVLAVLLRYARASIPWMGSPQKYLTGIGLGLLGGLLEAASGDAWQATVKTGLSLAACVVVGEKALEELAKTGKLPAWLCPPDNHFVKKPEAPTEGGAP